MKVFSKKYWVTRAPVSSLLTICHLRGTETLSLLKWEMYFPEDWENIQIAPLTMSTRGYLIAIISSNKSSKVLANVRTEFLFDVATQNLAICCLIDFSSLAVPRWSGVRGWNWQPLPGLSARPGVGGGMVLVRAVWILCLPNDYHHNTARQYFYSRFSPAW